MTRPHIFAPGATDDGGRTLCGRDLPLSDDARRAGHSVRHRVVGRICVKCRSYLLAHPQVLNALWAELVADNGAERAAKVLGGHPSSLVLNATVSFDRCAECGQPKGRPHKRACPTVTRF